MSDRKRDSAGRFPAGASGNPGGRPTRERQYAKRFPGLASNAEAIVGVAITQALAGDAGALALLIPRLLPAIRSIDPRVTLSASENVVEAAEAVTRATLAGEVSADVATRLMDMLKLSVELRNYEELAERIRKLEVTASEGTYRA